MKYRKRIHLGVLLLAMGLLSNGCGKQPGGDGVQRYAWPLGTSSPEDTVTQIYAESFANRVAELSDGKMKIQVYPNSTIGGDRELLETCADGDIPFVVQNTAPQVAFMPKLSIFDMPCVYETMEAVRKKLDETSFYRQLETVYKDSGYRLLGYADQGFRVMSTNRRIEELKDFKGQKIRTMENSYHLAFWKAIGANPTPMTFSEVYIGLQQKTIDAQENPYEVVVSGKLYEQQKYVVETNHLPHLISLIVSDTFFEELPEEKQEIITEAAGYAREQARKASDERIADKVKIIEEHGTTIIPLSDALREELRAASQPIYEAIRETAGDALADAYLTSAE